MSSASVKGRLEDTRLIQGAGRYSADWNLPGQAYAAFVRSDRAHAELLGIDTSAARAHPGVLAVLTAADFAEAKLQSLPTLMPIKGHDGFEIRKPHRPVLAQGKVRFVGEPVAIVIATSAAIAQDAAELVAVDYTDLPAVTDSVAALTPDAPQLHEVAPGNLVFDYSNGAPEATDAAFAAAARTVKLSVDMPRVVANPMEPRACIGSYDATEQTWTLHACTQGAFHMRTQLAGVLGVPVDKLRVIAQDVGGSFGVHSNAYPEDCAVLLAAKHLGRPVKWQASRSESFVSDEQGRGMACVSELALDAQGKFLAFRFNFTANLGAYLTLIGPVANTIGTTACLTGVYAVPAASARTRLAFSNMVPAASYRGAGRPLMAYAIERLIEQAAHELGIDPAELRARNLVPKEAMPYKLPNGTTYDCGDFPAVLAKALAAADWAGFAARRAQSEAQGKLRGRGLSVFIEMSGAGFVPKDQVQLRFVKDAQGRINLTLNAATHNHGQGHETSFAHIISGVLGLAPERIRLITSGPVTPQLEGNLTSGARTLAGVGSVMLLAAQEVAKNAHVLAAKALQCPESAIRFAHGVYSSAEGSTTFEALAMQHAGDGPHPLSLDFEAKFGATFPNGCHIAEVEIDRATGTAQVVRYTACDDIGNVVNHQIVEGQVHGGLAQGAGEVFGEQAIYDAETGQLLTGSFMDYPMPRVSWVPPLTLLESPVPTAVNPLGVKGVGEAGTTGSMPALMNAVLDAMRGAGVQHFDMPATPARVWAALRSAPQAGRLQGA